MTRIFFSALQISYVRWWIDFKNIIKSKVSLSIRSFNLFQVEPALMFDSVYVFVAGLAAFGQKHTLRPANLSCDLEKPWQDGLQLHNHISSVSIANSMPNGTKRRRLKLVLFVLLQFFWNSEKAAKGDDDNQPLTSSDISSSFLFFSSLVFPNEFSNPFGH